MWAHSAGNGGFPTPAYAPSALNVLTSRQANPNWFPHPGLLRRMSSEMTLFDLDPIAPLQLHSERGPTPAKKKATATVLPFAKKAKDQPRFAGAFSFAEPLGREGASDSGASRGAGGVGLSNASIRRLSCSDTDSCWAHPLEDWSQSGWPASSRLPSGENSAARPSSRAA